MLTRIGMHESGHSEWKIEDNFGNSFNVQADVKVPSDGKLSVSGKEIELAYHTADEVVSLFVTKPDITPGIKAQIEQMEKILTPLNNPRVSIDEANQAYSAIHSFARDHRGPALEAEIVEWIKSQPAASQRILNRYYSDPINESVRQSDFLSKTTFSMVRKGLIKPDVIDYITRFPDKIEESTRLTDEQKAKTLKNVLQLLDNGSDPKASPDSRTAPFGMYQIAAIQSAMHVAEPDTVTQYAHPTCAMASLEVSAYTRTPDVATDLVSQVLRTGKFVAGDGTVIKIDPLSMRPERGSESINRVAFNQYSNKDVFRSYASQIFQTTAQNVFWQTRTRNPDGDRVPKGSLRYELHFGTRPGVEGTPTGFVVDYSGKRPKYWEAEGYRDEDINATSDLISDRLRHRPIPSSALKTFDTFKDWLARAPREDMPVSIGVDARYLSESLKGEPDILGHAINIHASFDPVEPGGGDKWMVAIKNPWDGRTKFITIPELWKMAYERDHFKGPMGQTSKTMVPVSRSNFEAATGK
ncbi:MAG: hypothetical protein JST89_16260 [Cyanobacteria bacterium SZAS-4]|nr:hypothetical protein [Cyanobacteria bacterium SZAS-4]